MITLKNSSLVFTGHAGFMIHTSTHKTIAIDPYNLTALSKKADYILITHNHYDHCSIKDLALLVKPSTTLVIPADAQSKITKIEGIQMQIVEIGDEIEFADFKLQVLSAYNIHKPFHPKSERGHGYLLKLENNLIIYHAGDTDLIPEMKKLTGYAKKGNEFVTLLPVSGTYVMTAQEAAQAAALIKPTLAIPMHYGAGVAGTREDAESFVTLCALQKINAQILEKE